MTKSALKGQRLAALAALGWLLFNWPLLYLFSAPGEILGIPKLFVWLFAAWAALIAALALVIERTR